MMIKRIFKERDAKKQLLVLRLFPSFLHVDVEQDFLLLRRSRNFIKYSCIHEPFLNNNNKQFLLACFRPFSFFFMATVKIRQKKYKG